MSSEEYYKAFNHGKSEKKVEIMELKTEQKVLDHGYVRYIGHLGNDELVIEAARQSTQKGFLGWGGDICPDCKGESVNYCAPGRSGIMLPECKKCSNTGKIQIGDEKLLDFLWSNDHSTPMEMGDLVIQVKAPIMVFREWHRHRTMQTDGDTDDLGIMSFNEMSGRYIQMPNEHYIPIPRLQDTKNKQGSVEFSEDSPMAYEWMGTVRDQQSEIYEFYDKSVAHGIAKEVARINTPVSRYSIMYAKANLRNWFWFLNLRMRPNAQLEIRQYANAVSKIIHFLWPRNYSMFLEYQLNAVRFSASEMRQLKDLIWANGEVEGRLSSDLSKKIFNYKEIA